MIIGTAGHIDHGKTALVKALTGIDADRLPEEKARGITIDLGFAYTPDARGRMLGFVDVPGHEKFVHTMAAGAVGMDHGLLVVAADDGWMPQTREHLRILDLLGVPGLTVAISKIDLVDAARSLSVQEEVLRQVATTRFGQVHCHLVSVRTGEGVAVLKEDLFALAERAQPDAAAYFRLAIDRVFVVKGMGVAVTGAVIAGVVHVGDVVCLGARQTRVRVRSIHAQNTPAEFASVGSRCGIVITGVELAEVQRGDWLVAPELNLLAQRFDCVLTVPADAERAVRDGELVLLHHGTEQASARLLLLNAERALPGERVYAQCVVDRPLPVCWHDRIVLRDVSARVTLAGAQVLDIAPPMRGRKKPERLRALAELENVDPAQALRAMLLNGSLPIDLCHWARAMNRREADLFEAVRGQVVSRLEADAASWLLCELAQRILQDAVGQGLSSFHADQPDEPGLAIERLRRMCCAGVRPALFRAWVTHAIEIGQLALTGSFVHQPGHRVELSAQEQLLWTRVLPALLAGGFDPPWVRDLAMALAVSEQDIRQLLRKQARQSLLVQLVTDLFYPHATMIRLADMVRALINQDGVVRVIQFRDGLQVGRKRAIQILEACDRFGLTRRLVTARRGQPSGEKDHRILRNPDLFTREGC